MGVTVLGSQGGAASKRSIRMRGGLGGSMIAAGSAWIGRGLSVQAEVQGLETALRETRQCTGAWMMEHKAAMARIALISQADSFLAEELEHRARTSRALCALPPMARPRGVATAWETPTIAQAWSAQP